MKKNSILFFLFFLASFSSFGQQAPMGMKYQAVARDLKGVILADQQLTLKVTLAGNNGQAWSNYYTETHAVETGQLGLFTVVIGEGQPEAGKFADVPWSSQDIWMEIAIRDKNNGYAVISNSKLLAVPFAFHALTASEIVGGNIRSSGVPSNVWSLFGNSNTNPLNDALGTTDNVDMIVITNNIERMRLLANGNIKIVRSLDVGANLKVDSSVVLNDKSGSTINNGPFTVARNSPTLLSGTLTVDLATDLNATLNVDGPTDLNSRLNVNNQMPTKLTGSLQVDGVATLKDTSFVANGKPTILTGSLRVDSNGVFKQKLILDNAALDQDTATLVPNGALQVAGGGGFGGNLTIGGSAKIGGGLSLGNLKVTDTTSSYNTITGAMTVAGGAGIGKQLNVGGATTIGSTLTVNANSSGYVAYFNNTANANGIAIKVGAGTPSHANDYITFQNSSGAMVGRIEGETLDELYENPDYKFDLATKIYDVVSGGIDLGLASFNLYEAITQQISSAASVNTCVGLGVVLCPPIISLIVGSVATLVVAIIEEVLVIGEVVVASINLAGWKSDQDANVGVTYQSGSGDYAEYLLKANPEEMFFPGDIVGVKGGKISKKLDGAERVMVVSTKPIVLGNTPPEGQEKNYEKIAFMGQVPVMVYGKVKLGDYIIPNGVNNGVGIAVSPDEIRAEDVRNIVGIAWSTADNATALNKVTAAIGLNINDNQKLILKQQDEIKSLKDQIAQTNAQLEKLVPGFKAPGAATQPVVTTTTTPVSTLGAPAVQPSSDPVRYLEVKKEYFIQGFEAAYERMVAKGNMEEKYQKFWDKFNSDPEYKKLIIDKLVNKYNQELAAQKALDAKLYNR